MVGRLVEIPLAAGRPMRARTKDNWEAGARGRRRTPWTAVGASSPVRAIEDPVAQIAWEIVARVAEIASVTAAFLQGAGQGEEELLVAAQVGRAEPTHEQAVRAAHPAWGPVVVDGVAAADGGNQPIVEEKTNEKENYLDRLQRLCGLHRVRALRLHCHA